MSLNACAAIVERADPDRFRAAMAAPASARRVLFPLYAFNVEIARAPWVTQEPMIAEMRLQWWRDVLEEISADRPARRHEVVDALADVLDDQGARDLDALIDARRWDIYKDAFEDAGHLDEYVMATSGGLMKTAARLLGVCDADVVGDFAYATGIANLFRAVPELEARGRKPLADGTQAGVQALALKGLARLNAAAKLRRKISKPAQAGLLSGWATRPTLCRAIQSPAQVGEAMPMVSPLRLPWVAVAGWWR